MNHIGKILPVEGYYVQLKNTPSLDFQKSLTHLYQPLIGMEAIMLYQTLLNEIDLQFQEQSTLQTHHTLMSYLNLPLDTIYKARLKLEAIGLLKTYEQDSTIHRSYMYVLQSPYAPCDFFKDDMLSELLYHHLGESKYDTLKRKYNTYQDQMLDKEITANFSDVFGTVQPTLANKKQTELSREQPKGPNIDPLDFSWLETMLHQRMIPVENVLTKSNKQFITNMTFLYDLEAHEIEKTVLWALNEENRLDVAEFKEACHDLFKTKQKQTPIALQPKQTEDKQEKTSQPKSKEDQLIARLQDISPKQLLEDLSSGKQASEQDMKLIRDVMTSQGLPTPVMNVLIHFVLLQTNMKLSKAYLEKIASHWSRADLTNAKEAMQFAKKEIDSFQNKRQPRNMSRNQRKEVIPDWFKERHNPPQPSAKESEKTNSQAEKEREELAALIRQYAGE